jgi:hypothetical protein
MKKKNRLPNNTVQVTAAAPELRDRVIGLANIKPVSMLGSNVFFHYNGPTDQFSAVCAGMAVLDPGTTELHSKLHNRMSRRTPPPMKPSMSFPCSPDSPGRGRAMKMKTRFTSMPLLYCCLVAALIFSAASALVWGTAPDSSPAGEWKPLFNGKNLDGWSVVIREKKSEDPAQSNTKLGDPNHLVQVHDGAIHMYRDAPAGSEQPFGYISTSKEYSEYDLRLEYRWGVKRFAPRADSPRDSGILYHMTGIDRVWPQSVECQIWEGDVGDTYAVYTRVTAPVDPARIRQPVYLAAEAGGVPHVVGSYTEIGRVGRNPKSEQEGWNTIEVRVRGDRATYIVNGVTNNEVTKMEQWVANAWAPLRKGRIALQLEGAEILYRNIQIREVDRVRTSSLWKTSCLSTILPYPSSLAPWRLRKSELPSVPQSDIR